MLGRRRNTGRAPAADPAGQAPARPRDDWRALPPLPTITQRSALTTAAPRPSATSSTLAQPQLPGSAQPSDRHQRARRGHPGPRRPDGEPGTAHVLPRPPAPAGCPPHGPGAAFGRPLEPLRADDGTRRGPRPATSSRHPGRRGATGADQHRTGQRPGPGAAQLPGREPRATHDRPGPACGSSLVCQRREAPSPRSGSSPPFPPRSPPKRRLGLGAPLNPPPGDPPGASPTRPRPAAGREVDQPTATHLTQPAGRRTGSSSLSPPAGQSRHRNTPGLPRSPSRPPWPVRLPCPASSRQTPHRPGTRQPRTHGPGPRRPAKPRSGRACRRRVPGERAIEFGAAAEATPGPLPADAPPAEAPLIGALPLVTHTIEPFTPPDAAASLPGPVPLPAVQMSAQRSVPPAQAPSSAERQAVQRSVSTPELPPGHPARPPAPALAVRPATPAAKPFTPAGRPFTPPTRPPAAPEPVPASVIPDQGPAGQPAGSPDRLLVAASATALEPARPDGPSPPPRDCPVAR